MKKVTKILLILLAFAFILSCRTAVSVTVTKPAEVNMSGARNIAVFDFTYPIESRSINLDTDDLLSLIIASALDIEDSSGEVTLQEKMGNYMTSQLVSGLVETDYFTVYTPNDVSQALIGADSSSLGMTDVGLLLGADAIVVGSIDDMQWGDEQYIKERKVYNKKTKKTRIVRDRRIKRTIEIAVTYRVVNAETGNVIATESDRKTSSDDELKENEDRLNSFESMFQGQINNMIKAITRKLAPYKVRETRFLKKDKLKDPRMENADNFVKGQIYDKALNIYLEVWDDSQNIAAGFNAAIMKEVMGDLEGAKEMMGIVMELYPDSEVMSQYNRLDHAIDQRREVEEQMK
jgi:curli biogenesis system outer membrane secretion channel CsgG